MEEERTMNNNVVMEKEGVELNMSLVDKYYYVCNLCLCSGIFTSPEDLHYHNQHQHKNVEELNQELQLQLSESSDSEVDNEKQEDSSVDTDPEEERPAPASVKKKRKLMRNKLVDEKNDTDDDDGQEEADESTPGPASVKRSMMKNRAAKVNRQGSDNAKAQEARKEKKLKPGEEEDNTDKAADDKDPAQIKRPKRKAGDSNPQSVANDEKQQDPPTASGKSVVSKTSSSKNWPWPSKSKSKVTRSKLDFETKKTSNSNSSTKTVDSKEERISDSTSVTEKDWPQENSFNTPGSSVLDKTSAVKKASSSKQTPSSSKKSDANEWTCSKCSYSCKSSYRNKNHILSHYYSDFKFILPSCPPFRCPECQREVRDKITLTRHYAFTHKKLFEVTDLTEEKLKQMMKV